MNQVRQRILAEKLRFQSFWLTEHHFQPKGAEMSPNPLMVQMSVAAHPSKHHAVRHMCPRIPLVEIERGPRFRARLR